MANQLAVRRTYMSCMTLDLGPELLISTEYISLIIQRMLNYNNLTHIRRNVEYYQDPTITINEKLITTKMETKRKLYFICLKNQVNDKTFRMYRVERAV